MPGHVADEIRSGFMLGNLVIGVVYANAALPNDGMVKHAGTC